MRILVSSLVDLQKSAHNSRLHQFLHHLCQHHEITVISINDWWKTEWDSSADYYNQDFLEMFQKIKFYYLTEKKVSPVLQDLIAPLLLWKNLNEIDFSEFDVHFNYNTFNSGYQIAQIVKNHNIPTVYDIADDLPEMIRTSPQIPCLVQSFGAWFGKRTMCNNVKISKNVTLTTESLGEAYHLPKSKTVVLPNGVDTNLFSLRDCVHIKKKYGLEQSFVLGFVGVMREWVDFHPLFAAIQQLDNTIDLKLLIVGGGIGYNETVKLVNQYGIQDKTIFTGTIPYPEVPEYISCLDVGIIPFKKDKVSKNSLPLKLFEYMACEIPVITTQLETVLDKFNNDVVFVSDASDYKNAILHLYQNFKLRKSLGIHGRKIVENEYQWNIISKRLEELFESVSEKK